MGIQFLNKFLKTECNRSIKEIGIRELSGKKIVVDIDIYMFKFSVENGLIENMYTMFSIFRHYQITPIFIFDGKTPTEKKELIEERREHKKQAELEYNALKNQIESSTDFDENEYNEIQNKMDDLKKQFIYLTKRDFEIVKQLIDAFGFNYIDAPGEADEICAHLTIKGKVWGCLSEDMDMFVYGCPRVIRYFSLLNHKCVLYDLKGILCELKINLHELKQICVLSGTDYNKKNKQINLYIVLKYFKKYKKRKIQEDFYIWLLSNSILIDNYELLLKVYSMFDINNLCGNVIQYLDYYTIKNKLFDKSQIKLLLKEDGFLFP
jgi:5'-3' exonuclease